VTRFDRIAGTMLVESSSLTGCNFQRTPKENKRTFGEKMQLVQEEKGLEGTWRCCRESIAQNGKLKGAAAWLSYMPSSSRGGGQRRCGMKWNKKDVATTPGHARFSLCCCCVVFEPFLPCSAYGCRIPAARLPSQAVRCDIKSGTSVPCVLRRAGFFDVTAFDNQPLSTVSVCRRHCLTHRISS
jgi:hypothetical protein